MKKTKSKNYLKILSFKTNKNHFYQKKKNEKKKR